MMVMKMVVVVMMEGNTHLLRGVSRRQSRVLCGGVCGIIRVPTRPTVDTSFKIPYLALR